MNKPNTENGPNHDPLRRTGRTQEMLEAAVAAAANGERVDVLGMTHNHAKVMADRVWRMDVPDLRRRTTIRFDHKSGGSLEFLSINANLAGRCSIVFTDHAATGYRAGRMRRSELP